MEQFLYNVTRGSPETPQSYVTRKTNKHTEMMQQFAQVTHKCSDCNNETRESASVPEELRTYLLKKGASLSLEQNYVSMGPRTTTW